MSKRVFISYGHDENTSLAVRLRQDLKARGHDVWFDDERIQPGYCWEPFIERGLEHLAADLANSAVILLLTPYAVRRPRGYCLNEVDRALMRGLRIIPIMVVESEPPLSICRIQWLDMRECIPISQKEALYLPRFERLLKALEDDQLDFEGTQNRLLRALKPIGFSATIMKLLQDFTGRQWVINKVDNWLKDPSGASIFWIRGDVGTGKSAVAAWLRDNRREIVAFHFCDIFDEEKRNPKKLVCSIVYQLATQLPDYQDRLASLPVESILEEYNEPYTIFDKLLIQPLAENFPEPDRTLVVLIDALDEATYKRQNEIVRFLRLKADKIPRWLRFLVTSRPEPEILSSFHGLSPYVLDTAKPENLQDLRDYLAIQFPGITREKTEAILQRSEGIFLYIVHVCQEIRAGHLSLERPQEFPRGLGDQYKQFFDRQFAHELSYYEEKITPLLYIVLAAFEPLTLGFIKNYLGLESKTDLFKCLNRLGSLFPWSGETDTDTIRPFHRSICDWISVNESSYPYYIDIEYGHKILAGQGWAQYEKGPENMEDYFLKWLPSHLMRLDDRESMDKLECLLTDFRYLMEKTRRRKLDRLLRDFSDLPAHLTAAKAPLELPAAFFREKAHILRRGNEEWPAFKILMQLAIEHADDSPLAFGAEQWLIDGRCDWHWLRRGRRPHHARISPCLVVFEGHHNAVSGAIETRDGRFLSWSEDRTLRLWDQDGGQITTLEGHSREIKGALETRDGRFLSWSEDRTLRLWDQDGRQITALEGHSREIKGALETQDGRFLSWSGDRTLRLWDQNGRQIATLEGHSYSVLGSLEARDGRFLSWSNDRTLRLWNQDGRPIVTLEGHSRWVNGALETRDGRFLSWSADSTLRFWDQDGGQITTLEGHSREVLGALETNNGRFLSWYEDRTLRLWDQDGRQINALEGHSGTVLGARKTRHQRFLSWSEDCTLRLWDHDGKQINALGGHSGTVLGALETRDGRFLSWAQDGALRLWNQESKEITALEGHSRRLTGALETRDGRFLSWSEDRTLRLWDDEGRKIAALEGHPREVLGALETRDGRFLSWSEDRTLRLWDQDGRQAIPLKGHLRTVVGALETRDGRFLSWSEDRTLRLWDQDGRQITALEGHIREILGALETQEGQFLSWAGDGTLKLWDQDGKKVADLEGHLMEVLGVFETRDGLFLSWARDGSLRLWDRNGKEVAVLEGHLREILGAFETRDGQFLSWAGDRTLRLWNRDGKQIATFEGHLREVLGAFETHDGRFLSWAGDGALRLWDQNGLPLEIWSYEEGFCRFPEFRLAYGTKENNVSRSFFHGGDKCGQVQTFCRGRASTLLWHGESHCTARHLKSDGRAVLTQQNGHVCFLQIYHGSRPITIAELEQTIWSLGYVEIDERNTSWPSSEGTSIIVKPQPADTCESWGLPPCVCSPTSGLGRS